MKVTGKANFNVVGKSIPRLDSVEKVTGRVEYGINMKVPGMLWGKLLRSPFPCARILKIDTSLAKAIPGVECIITGEDVPDRKIGRYMNDMYALARERVRYVGEPVAAVAAIDEETAERAVRSIQVDYEELPAVFDVEEAMKDTAPRVHKIPDISDMAIFGTRGVHPVPGTNICNRSTIKKGDVDSAFARSDFVFEDSFTTHTVQHCHMEPHAAVASVSHSGKITVWTNNQRPFELRTYLVHLLALPTTSIRIIGTEAGGGFGAKKSGWERFPVLMALKCGKPVKMVMTRDEEFIDGYTSVPLRATVRTGVRKDGTITAMALTLIWDTGAYCHGAIPSFTAKYVATGPYRVPNLRLESVLVYTNKVPGTTYRGIGGPDMAFAVESQLDMIARKLGLDPVEFRLKNMMEEGDESPISTILSGVSAKQCLEKVAEGIQWDKPSQGQNRGKGIACFDRESYMTSACCVLLWLNEDGKVTLVSGAREIGQGLKTVLAQMCAEELGVKLEDVDLVLADTGVTPFDDGAYGTRLTEGGGNAVRLAAADAKRQILKAASRELEVNEASLNLKEGRIFVKDAPERGMPLKQLAFKLHTSEPGPILGRGSFVELQSLPKIASEAGQQQPGWKFGATGAEVEVDTDTGAIKILKLVSAHDVGLAINPMSVEGQIEGAVIMGLANTMLEEMQFDQGRVINPSFMDYRIPTAHDCPSVVPIIVEEPNELGPFGAKGVGELGMMGAGPAVVNAIYNALGIRIKTWPITGEKMLQALAGTKEGNETLREVC